MGSRPAWVSLIGPRRAGKSTLARALGERLGRPSIDLDAWIENWSGQSIAEIFAEHGEPGFRRMERGALEQVLKGPPAILATGGGTPIDPASAAQLRSAGLVVHLALCLEVQKARLALDPSPAARPRLAEGPIEAELERLHRLREPRYREIAHMTINGDADRAIVVENALAAIERWERGLCTP